MALRGTTFFPTGHYLLPYTRGRDDAVAAVHAARQEDVERGSTMRTGRPSISGPLHGLRRRSTRTPARAPGEGTWYFHPGKVLDSDASMSTTAIRWRTSSRS